jgi:hypothetical protein
VNSYSHDNGEDGFGLNSGTTGTVVAKHFNTIAARNGQANWTTYDGAHLEIYNSVGIGSPFNFHAFASYAGWPVPTHKIRNSYLRVLTGGRQVHYYNLSAGAPTFDSDYNIWAPNLSNSEAWDDTGTGKTYTNPPSWKGAHDKVGLAYIQAFVDTATDNYFLADNTGPANKAGLYITTPTEALTDRAGFPRTNPPDIGAYQFGDTSTALAPPSNLRVVQ